VDAQKFIDQAINGRGETSTSDHFYLMLLSDVVKSESCTEIVNQFGDT
jgi:hypothetical protein